MISPLLIPSISFHLPCTVRALPSFISSKELNLLLALGLSICCSVCSIPGSGRSPGEGNGNPLLYSCLKYPMDREAWQAMGSQELDTT